MALDIRPLLWLIILRGMQHTQLMYCWPCGWICSLVGSKTLGWIVSVEWQVSCTEHEFPSQPPRIPQHAKGHKAGPYQVGLVERSPLHGLQKLIPQAVVPSGFLTFSLISKSSNHWFKKLLRLLDTCAYFCQNSTANLILLSFFEGQSNGIFTSTVITLLQPFKKTSQRLLHQFISKLFSVGSFEWSVGWKLTSQNLEQRVLKPRWKNLVKSYASHRQVPETVARQFYILRKLGVPERMTNITGLGEIWCKPFPSLNKRTIVWLGQEEGSRNFLIRLVWMLISFLNAPLYD